MSILGIDPGLSGGIVLLSTSGTILFKSPIPVLKLQGKKNKTVIDLPALYEMIKSLKEKTSCCYLEKVSSMPGQGVSSMFSFGHTFGVIEMSLVACQIPYVLVPPQTWCKEIHQGLSKDLDAKSRSMLIFKRLYPDVDLRATERCSTPHLGMLDGLLIAEFGRRQAHEI